MKDTKSFLSLLVLLGITLLLVMGCKKEEEEDVTTTASTATELEGAWNSGCIVDPDPDTDPSADAPSYVKSTVTFTNNTMNTTEARYDSSDDTCSSPMMIADQDATFTIGASVTTTDVPPISAKKIDTTIVTMKMTIKDQNMLDFFFNAVPLPCGVTFVLDVTQDITGQTCHFGDPSDDGEDFSAGVINYTIYDLSGDTFLQQYVDSSTDSGRPTSFSNPLSFTKQL